MSKQYPITPERLKHFIQLSELLLDESGLNEALAKTYFQIIIEQSPDSYGPGDEYTQFLADTTDGHPLDAIFAVMDQVNQNQVNQEQTDNTLDVFSGLIAGDSTLAPIVNNIIILWYNGYLNNCYPPAKYYAEALVWKVIQANPPGITGPYYGHWAYPPEQQISKPES
ncbi:hypothetical protein [Aliikangiella sp. IMCC44359]|uniref:hypothetical protein n=1 Tax=Aliikangiella sp. IMCC44359 TaxID=3459125 RepID=UPI00403B33B2